MVWLAVFLVMLALMFIWHRPPSPWQVVDFLEDEYLLVLINPNGMDEEIRQKIVASMKANAHRFPANTKIVAGNNRSLPTDAFTDLPEVIDIEKALQHAVIECPDRFVFINSQRLPERLPTFANEFTRVDIIHVGPRPIRDDQKTKRAAMRALREIGYNEHCDIYPPEHHQWDCTNYPWKSLLRKMTVREAKAYQNLIEALRVHHLDLSAYGSITGIGPFISDIHASKLIQFIEPDSFSVARFEQMLGTALASKLIYFQFDEYLESTECPLLKKTYYFVEKARRSRLYEFVKYNKRTFLMEPNRAPISLQATIRERLDEFRTIKHRERDRLIAIARDAYS